MSDNIDKNQIHSECRRNEVDIDIAGLARKLSEEEKFFIADLLSNDPLGASYKKCLIVYLVIAIVLLFWPFDFVFSPPGNGAVLLKTSNGIEFVKAGKIISSVPAKHVYDQMLSGSGLSLKVWVASTATEQSGPARIISYSLDHSRRNFTLGQSQQNLIMRLRTTRTDINGRFPHMVVDNVFNTTQPQHIIVTYDYSAQPIQRVYVNGKIRAEQAIPGGDFSNWDPYHYLVLGNEVTGERPWAGKIFNVSIYNRAFTHNEVRKNYMADAAGKAISQEETDLVTSGLVVRYIFDEHTGKTIQDSSGSLPSLNLTIPEKLIQKYYLTFSFVQFANIRDTFLNLILFIPFGFFLSGTIQKKYCLSLVKTFSIVLIAGAFFTIFIESIQYFLPSRSSSLVDVINNILSTILGFLLFLSWKKLLKTQTIHNQLFGHFVK